MEAKHKPAVSQTPAGQRLPLQMWARLPRGPPGRRQLARCEGRPLCPLPARAPSPCRAVLTSAKAAAGPIPKQIRRRHVGQTSTQTCAGFCDTRNPCNLPILIKVHHCIIAEEHARAWECMRFLKRVCNGTSVHDVQKAYMH